MAKRGRKRKGYFYEEQEQAVADYNSTDDQDERNRIFNTWLKPAFTKMIESIIRRYKLYIPDEDFEETFNDTMSFLMTKIQKFDFTKGFKAYSYCGTICKNYLLSKVVNVTKLKSLTGSYDAMYDNLKNSSKYLSEESSDYGDEKFLANLIAKTSNEIKRIIGERESYCLTDDEVMVGMALVDLFENYEDVFDDIGSNKFNKSSILLYLKELTHLTTPEIRQSMKKYKSAYYNLKLFMVQEI